MNWLYSPQKKLTRIAFPQGCFTADQIAWGGETIQKPVTNEDGKVVGHVIRTFLTPIQAAMLPPERILGLTTEQAQRLHILRMTYAANGGS